MIVLRLLQSGSIRSKAVTAKTGRTDEDNADDSCDLCKNMKETVDHIWFCPALRYKTKEVNPELAEIDPCASLRQSARVLHVP